MINSSDIFDLFMEDSCRQRSVKLSADMIATAAGDSIDDVTEVINSNPNIFYKLSSGYFTLAWGVVNIIDVLFKANSYKALPITEYICFIMRIEFGVPHVSGNNLKDFLGVNRTDKKLLYDYYVSWRKDFLNSTYYKFSGFDEGVPYIKPADSLKGFLDDMYRIAGYDTLGKVYEIYIKYISGSDCKALANETGYTKENVRIIINKAKVTSSYAIVKSVDQLDAFVSEKVLDLDLLDKTLADYDEGIMRAIIMDNVMTNKTQEFVMEECISTCVRNKNNEYVELKNQFTPSDSVIKELPKQAYDKGFTFLNYKKAATLILNNRVKCFPSKQVKRGNRVSLINILNIAMEEHFPDGIRIADRSSLNKLNHILQDEYGVYRKFDSQHNMAVAIQRICVLVGRGKYRATPAGEIPTELFNKMVDEVRNTPEKKAYVSDLFVKHKDSLTPLGIDNYYALHGSMRYYNKHLKQPVVRFSKDRIFAVGGANA